MSEPEAVAVTAEPVSVGTAVDAGALLRVAREAQGLHIAALAVALKVPVKRLEALEAGRYDELPDMAFTRSLAMSVCRTLKISPTEVLAALPGMTVRSIKPASDGLNTQFKSSDFATSSSLRAQLSSPMGIGAGVLLLATAAILLWQDKAKTPDVVAAPEPMALVAPAPAQDDSALAAVDEQAPLKASDASATTQAAAGATASASESISASVPDTPDVLVLKARGVSWVEVSDAEGAPKLHKLTRDGEVLRVTGKLPLSVTVGRANLVAVQVRGQALDLTALTRGNVARFEVK